MEEFIKKIVKIQIGLKAPKGQYNSFGKYKYRSCEDIVEAVKPLLAENGLIINLSDSVEIFGNRVYIKSVAKITDGKNEVQSIGYAREPETKKGMDESQITGTASSYARKYALNGLLAIDDTKDADTDQYKYQQNKTKESKKLNETSEKKILLNKNVEEIKKISGLKQNEIVALIEKNAGVKYNPEETKIIEKYIVSSINVLKTFKGGEKNEN